MLYDMVDYRFSLLALVISIIIFVIMVIKIKKNIKWIILFSISLIPLITLLFAAIDSAFNGGGFMNSGGILAAIFTIETLFIFKCYIFIPALVAAILSFRKIFKNK